MFFGFGGLQNPKIFSSHAVERKLFLGPTLRGPGHASPENFESGTSQIN